MSFEHSLTSFERVHTTRLFVLSRGTDDAAWCGYLLPSTELPDGPITIPDAFSKFLGTYLFALKPPPLAEEAQVNAFIGAVEKYLQVGNSPFRGRACVWIPDPIRPEFGPRDRFMFSFETPNATTVLTSNFNHSIGERLTFAAPSGTLLDGNNTGLRLKGSIEFATQQPGDGPSIAPNEARLPFLGPYSGCFVITGRLGPKTTDLLRAGFRYGHAGEPNPRFQEYRVFSAGGWGAVKYVGTLDPLDHVNAELTPEALRMGRLRSQLALGIEGNLPPLPSVFRTDGNRAISLVPQGSVDGAGAPAPGSGGLVFEHAATNDVYLTPAGEYGLAVEGQKNPQRLLCGIFGGETIGFRPYVMGGAFDRLRFLPRQAAFAPAFPFVDASLKRPDIGLSDPLDTTCRTAWAGMVAGAGDKVRYSAEPDRGTLYGVRADAADGDGDPPLLDPFDPSTVLPAWPGLVVPMVPYADLPDGFARAHVGAFESQILASTRQAAVARSGHEALLAVKNARRTAQALGQPTDNGVPTTTPQGLLATIARGAERADYTKVTLAQFERPPGTVREMAFLDLGPQLQRLFQTNQLFAVIVNPKFLGKFQNELTIAGWTISAKVGDRVQATDYHNAMIFKFGEGSVKDRVKNPNQWMGADDFSVAAGMEGAKSLALNGLSTWLQRFIAAAIADAQAGNTLFENFARIVQDQHWNGILVLQAEVSPSGLPRQLAGLTAGIDVSQFLAHHVGVEISRVKVEGGTLKIDGTSSMFGLVDYQLPVFRQNLAAGGNPDVPLGLSTAGRYDFHVLQLQALFTNSALSSFVSRVQLTAHELFGSTVLDTYDRSGRLSGNGVVLRGSLQGAGDAPDAATYVFEQKRTTVFRPDSNVVDAYGFTRVEFNTLTADSGGPDPQILSRFNVWGVINFATLVDEKKEPVDLLSFGTDADIPSAERGVGLAFSNLHIDLASPVSTPSALRFNFDATNIALDPAASAARKNSLFRNFALQVDRFLTEPGDKRPVNHNYLPVGLPLAARALDGPWYGVIYKLNMGSPGALVSAAGFESTLLLAWSPRTRVNDEQPAVFAGLRLPGASPGAQTLSLQGVLQVSVGGLDLQFEPVRGGKGKAFNLRLNDVGLKFMGIAKLPPGATINFFLFGDADGTGALGWYAAIKMGNEAVLQEIERGVA